MCWAHKFAFGNTLPGHICVGAGRVLQHLISKRISGLLVAYVAEAPGKVKLAKVCTVLVSVEVLEVEQVVTDPRNR